MYALRRSFLHFRLNGSISSFTTWGDGKGFNHRARIEPSQKAALLEAAALKPEWETAFFAAQIALQTTMRGCEIRGLRWADINLLADTLTIRKSKTEAGVRVIPLTPDSFEVFVQLRKRAELFGPVEPQHFVFCTL